MLTLQNVSCGYHGKAILQSLNLTIKKGEIVCLLGANVVGKTTLYRTLMQILPPIAGTMLLDGQDMQELSRASLAKRLAYVPQSHKEVHPYSVIDVVTMGRTAHLSLFRSPSKAEEEHAWNALCTFKIQHLGHRMFSEISGGERQLVYIARAMAQNTDILLMDEPTANLDLGRRALILETIHTISHMGKSVIYSTHSPADAFTCCDTVVSLLGGCRYTTGQPADILTEALLYEMYGVSVDICTVPTRFGNAQVCLPFVG